MGLFLGREGRGGGPLWLESCGFKSDSHDVLGLQSFGPLLDLELHLRTFIQAAVAVSLDRRKMHEHVVAARSLDKSIAFGGIKPFHYALFFHYTFS
jgi:hypothetical protein